MESTHSKHLKARCDWLQRIIEKKELSSKLHRRSILTMKDFVDLAVEAEFPKTSYNTLKRHAKNTIPTNNIAYPDYWTFLLALREEACQVIFDAYNVNPEPKIQNDAAVKNSLLHAHLCSTAYLEIFNHLEQISVHDRSLSDQTRFTIKKILDQSRVKYAHIISSEIPFAGVELKIIKGGKPG